MIKSILIVCTGNSCRSVMAEGLLKKFLKSKGCEDIKIISAGIGTMPGMMASPNTIEVMKMEGVDVSSHRAQLVTEDMIKDVDLVLGMEPVHVATVLSMTPEAKDKTFLLLEYVYKNENDKPTNIAISDPIGKPKEVYESVFMTIKDAIERLVKRICGSQ
ncbi:MAG: hypothetical protein AMJ78_06135 [Omnitrophica WOR_2 bacterium SM23_29]|nr:MAG: hypothetical protein AMJ78_06135 [Omnitrophica WOR_2 bacterium SM23_29]